LNYACDVIIFAIVETSVIHLREKVESLQGLGAKERKLWRMVTCLINCVCKSQLQAAEQGVLTKVKERTSEAIFRTASLDRNFLKKNICEKCKGISSPSKKHTRSPLDSMKPKADVEPIIRPDASLIEVQREQNDLDMLDQNSLKDRLMQLEAEKKDWEQRCRKLMQSVATNSKEYQKAMELAKEEISRLKIEKEADVKKCEAAFANKLAKVRQEADNTIWEYQKQVKELEEASNDLLQLQKNIKLTWVPDQLVKICQSHKCRLPFTQTTRKHHCRCCGRVFCHSCSSHKLKIPAFGYDVPVRICGNCFALIDDTFSNEETN